MEDTQETFAKKKKQEPIDSIRFNVLIGNMPMSISSSAAKCST